MIFPASPSAPLEPAHGCTSSHLTSSHWRLRCLVQTQDSHRPVILCLQTYCFVFVLHSCRNSPPAMVPTPQGTMLWLRQNYPRSFPQPTPVFPSTPPRHSLPGRNSLPRKSEPPHFPKIWTGQQKWENRTANQQKQKQIINTSITLNPDA